MLVEPHGESAHAAERQEYIVRPGADAEQSDVLGNRRPGLGIRRDRAEHDV